MDVSSQKFRHRERFEILRESAFSLVEMLVVVAIMVLLVALMAPAFNNIGQASLLSAEGNKMVNLIVQAGQNSISKNAMTALVAVPTTAGAGQPYRAFTLFQYAPGDSTWKQISKWEILKEGVVVDPTNFSFTEYPATKPSPDLPPMKFQGASIDAYKYLVFLPDRSLLQSVSSQIRLAEGFYAANASEPTFTRRGSNAASPVNFYNVTILNATSRPIIDRP